MKKMSAFFVVKRKRVSDFIKDMQNIELENQRNKLNKLMSERKSKLKQMLSLNYQPEQPQFKYLKKDYSEFIKMQPNSKLDAFVNEKQRRKLQLSDRAYSSSPNIKVGKPIPSKQRKSEIFNKQILSRMFEQYDQTIDSGSGPKRMAKLASLKSHVRVAPSKMKKTYFQRFGPSNFDFYEPQQYVSLKGSILARSRTDRDMHPLKMSKLKKVHSTLDSEPSRQHSGLDSLYRSQIKSKDTSFSKPKQKIKLQPVSLEKNLNSYQY